MHVVATAGHVDHGKSTLVEALTGQQPDRLEEERERGLSIALGYCWTRLPQSGDVAFVDVPGHERFVSTMLAGVGPVPCVLFVVAADDPWMPQAAEHLAVLDALRVRRGLLVVTRADLADARPALAAAQDAMKGSSLTDLPATVVSGVTGEGVSDVASSLDGLLAGMSVPSADAEVRLWVDRVFTLPGAGTVATGTLPAGRISVGDVLLCGDDAVAVRGLHSLGQAVETVTGIARVSIRVGAHAPPSLTRGRALVTPGGWASTSVVDVRIDGSDLPREPMVHMGSASTPARVRVLATASGVTSARLQLADEIPWHVGDRLLIRDPGSRRVWGADLMDPTPTGFRRRGDSRRRGQTLLTRCDVRDLAGLLNDRGITTREELRRLGYGPVELPDDVVTVGDWVMAGPTVAELRGRLDDLVGEHVREAPLDEGVSVAAAARGLGLPDERLLSAVVQAPLVLHGGRVAAATPTLPDWVTDALVVLDRRFAADPFDAPTADDLAELGLDRPAVAAAARSSRLLRLDDLLVVRAGADRLAAERLSSLPQPFTTSDARRTLGTSRRVALGLLGHLDRAGVTVRHSDDRRSIRLRVGPPAP